MSTLVIAEVSGMHGGSLEAALGLVDLAADVGADAVKFQWLSSPERLAARRRALEYLDAYRRLAFPHVWFPALRERAERRGLEFMCTAYLPEDVDVVAEHVARFKVASFEAADRHFLALHASYEKPIVLSTGMMSIREIEVAVRWYIELLKSSWRPGVLPRVDVLHCVSAYPCPDDQANLAAIRFAFGDTSFTGLSDHTRSPLAGAVAVAAGARVVEFHLRPYGANQADHDYAVSRDPGAARQYVANIRAAEVLLGGGVKRLMPAEEPMLRYRVER